MHRGETALTDLSLLCLEAQLWRQAGRGAAGRLLLARVLTAHAQFLEVSGRGRRCCRARAGAGAGGGRGGAGALVGRRGARRRLRPGPAPGGRGARPAARGVPARLAGLDRDPFWRSNLSRDMAQYAAEGGDYGQALHWIGEAEAAAVRLTDPTPLRLARHIRAYLLLRLRRWRRPCPCCRPTPTPTSISTSTRSRTGSRRWRAWASAARPPTGSTASTPRSAPAACPPRGRTPWPGRWNVAPGENSEEPTRKGGPIRCGQRRAVLIPGRLTSAGGMTTSPFPLYNRAPIPCALGIGSGHWWMASRPSGVSARRLRRPSSSVWVTVTFLWAAFEMPDGRGTALDVLDRAAARGVDVRLLFWRPDAKPRTWKRNAFWGSVDHIRQLEARRSGVRIRWDQAHPGFCQHQKSWLIDAGGENETAFVGGINLNPHSMVAPGHRGEGQNHDAYVEVAGPSAVDVHHNFVQRWNEASERLAEDGRWGMGSETDLPFPSRVPAQRGSALVQIQRTMHRGRYTDGRPAPGGAAFDIASGERSIFDQYCAAIGAAQRSIYIENQYIAVPEIVACLHQALQRGVEVVVLLPAEPDGFGPFRCPDSKPSSKLGRPSVRTSTSRWQASRASGPTAGASQSTCMPNSCWWMMYGPRLARAICTAFRSSETGR